MIDYAGAAARARYTVEHHERDAPSTFAYLRHLDWPLLAAVATLVGYGLWAIAGITRGEVDGDPNYYLVRQGIFAAVGAAGFIVALLIDPAVFRRHAWVVFAVMVALMLVVFAAAPVRGSTRWIDVGFFRFQPSEFGKLLFVLFVAGFLAERGRRILEARTVVAAVGFAAVPVLLVYVQPDIGTSLVYVAALGAILFVGGTRWTHLAALGAVAVLVVVSVLMILPAAGVHVLKPYQQDRLLAFDNPEHDLRGVGYNVNQSMTAVGAGGVDGRGVAGSTQTNFDFLPEESTDFVFAALAEQRGFIGASVLLLLYLFVVWRGLRIITVAREPFGAMVAGGIVLAFLFQIFVNVGMTMGIAPVTGIPLPFLSLGGSSMVANLIALGVLQALHARAHSDTRRDRRR